ncbi:MAG: MGDG synthase family glycosyltransferase [Anaerolineales bacterium]
MTSILILTLDSGSGHLAAAQAIAAGLERRYSRAVHTRIVDLSKEVGSGPLRKSREVYRWLAGNHPQLYSLLYHSDWFLGSPEFVALLCRLLAGPTLTKIYQSAMPDLVVSVHALLNHFPEKLLRTTLSSGIPFVTVVTDMLTFHRLWINPAVDYCVVPTEQARGLAVRYGLAPERVEVLGQPALPRFAEGRVGKEVGRRELGLDPHRPCVLITSGGDGIGRLFETARAIASRVPAVQLIVVAGRNRALHQRLLSTEWEVPARIYGFVDNMPELMGVSDLVVTKAGPGTLAEAFTVGLPVIVSSYIPGQEFGNPQYVAENGAGIFLQEPVEIAQAIRELIADPGRMHRMSVNAARLARPQASLRIAERLIELTQPEEAQMSK